MTKYVVSGYIGFDNFGDEAIARVLTKLLKQNNAEKITLISSNPSKTAKLYNVNAVGMFKFLKPILESDILISGGGSLLQDITSLKSLIYYLGIISTALVLNKKVIIFAQGFTPFRTKIGKLLTQFILKKCHKITVRDKQSQEILQKMGINSILVSDPVYGFETPSIHKSGVGIQLRSFPSLSDEFLEKLIKEVKARFPNQEIKLISLQDSVDLPALTKLEGKLVQKLSVEEAITELSSLEYLIGMRFHACLTAAKAGVKVLGINYDIKVETLAKSVGFPLVEMDGADLSERLEEMININCTKYQIPKFEYDFDF